MYLLEHDGNKHVPVINMYHLEQIGIVCVLILRSLQAFGTSSDRKNENLTHAISFCLFTNF